MISHTYFTIKWALCLDLTSTKGARVLATSRALNSEKTISEDFFCKLECMWKICFVPLLIAVNKKLKLYSTKSVWRTDNASWSQEKLHVCWSQLKLTESCSFLAQTDDVISHALCCYYMRMEIDVRYIICSVLAKRSKELLCFLGGFRSRLSWAFFVFLLCWPW